MTTTTIRSRQNIRETGNRLLGMARTQARRNRIRAIVSRYGTSNGADRVTNFNGAVRRVNNASKGLSST